MTFSGKGSTNVPCFIAFTFFSVFFFSPTQALTSDLTVNRHEPGITNHPVLKRAHRARQPGYLHYGALSLRQPLTPGALQQAPLINHRVSPEAQARVAGETLTQQWSKSFADSPTDYYPEKFDIDSDGIPELLLSNYSNAAAFSFYAGSAGALKGELNVTKPHPDWLIYMDEDNGYYCSSAGECYSKLQDIDGDGSKEYFVQLSSYSPGNYEKVIARIYDATTKTLEWYSPEETLSWGPQQDGWMRWNVLNMDSDDQKELVLLKTRNDSSSGQWTSSLDISVYDGASKAQQWEKTGLANVEFYEEDTLLDINSDQIPEVHFPLKYGFPGSGTVTFYDGATGNAAKQVTLTKPSADWTPSITYYGGQRYSPNGGSFYTLFDVDGDGEKEIMISLSSRTETTERSIVQLYNAASGAMELQYDEASISWGAGQTGGIIWYVSNLDDDPQKELILEKDLITSGPPYSRQTDITVYDGSTKAQQWTKSLAGSYSYYDPQELRDIDGDGIPEIQDCAAASCKFYDGKTGTLKAELTPTKPASDWEHYSPWTGWSAMPDGDNFMKFSDLDGDGNKEIFLQISSITSTGVDAKVQVYNASTMALKWQSDVMTLALGTNDSAMFDCETGNIDADAQKEFIVSLSKYNNATYTRSGTLTAYQYSVPGSAVAPGTPATIDTETADISVPAGAFPATVSIAVGTPAVLQPPALGQTASGVAVSITVTPASQPSKAVTIAIPYTPSDVSGMNISQIVIARYDDATARWIPLPSTVDTLNRTVTATTDHFSVFQIMQVSPSSSVSSVTMGPNPYRPSTNQGQVVTFRNLPAGATVKIYTSVGELVRELNANASGMAAWDGKNEGGKPAASGVYLALVQGSGGKKILKMALPGLLCIT